MFAKKILFVAAACVLLLSYVTKSLMHDYDPKKRHIC